MVLAVVGSTARSFARAIVMPNLTPPSAQRCQHHLGWQVVTAP
jgi:dihydroorotase